MILSDKVILVTGGSGLIGKAIIADIERKGGIAVNLDINVDTNIKSLNINLDINSDNSISHAIDIIIKEYGRIDGLVNNAYPRTKDWGLPFEDIPNESFSKNVDMQLSRVFALSKPVLKTMKEQENGSIVNIASIYGMVGNDFTVYEGTDLFPPAAYTAIKGGLINFNRYVASYYGQFNVRSNCVSPGGIFDGQNKKFVKKYEHKTPLKRMGNPDDIAPAVSFLLSDEAKYITGQNLAVDGGWTAI